MEKINIRMVNGKDYDFTIISMKDAKLLPEQGGIVILASSYVIGNRTFQSVLKIDETQSLKDYIGGPGIADIVRHTRARSICYWLEECATVRHNLKFRLEESYFPTLKLVKK